MGKIFRKEYHVDIMWSAGLLILYAYLLYDAIFRKEHPVYLVVLILAILSFIAPITLGWKTRFGSEGVILSRIFPRYYQEIPLSTIKSIEYLRFNPRKDFRPVVKGGKKEYEDIIHWGITTDNVGVLIDTTPGDRYLIKVPHFPRTVTALEENYPSELFIGKPYGQRPSSEKRTDTGLPE
jgi:hypothetical protein